MSKILSRLQRFSISFYFPLLSCTVVLLLWLSWPAYVPGVTYKTLAAATPPQPAASARASSSSSASSEEESTSNFVEKAGQTGDSFGGFSALFAALAFVGVAWAGLLEHRQLVDSRDVYTADRFESRFFQMLGLTRDITEHIETREGSRRGARALESLAAEFKNRYTGDNLYPPTSVEEDKKLLKRMVKDYVNGIYLEHPSALGPYFRLLFQTFKYIDEAAISPAEKTSYANIARGQISEGAVLLLAFNGLSKRGEKFVKYIQNYGLLEHMHPQYQTFFKPRLLHAYDSIAFMGSKERDAELLARRRGAKPAMEVSRSVFSEDD